MSDHEAKAEELLRELTGGEYRIVHTMTANSTTRPPEDYGMMTTAEFRRQNPLPAEVRMRPWVVAVALALFSFAVGLVLHALRGIDVW